MPKHRGKKMPDQTPYSARFQLTSEDEDRDGDIVVTAGLDWSQYDRNPVVLLGHNNSIPVGTCRGPDGKLAVEVGVQKAYGTCYFHEQTTEGKETAERVRRGILNAASIGFVPDKSQMTKSGRGHRIGKGKVLEWSIVAVPACESCLREDLKDFSEPVVKAVMSMATKAGECECKKVTLPTGDELVAKHFSMLDPDTVPAEPVPLDPDPDPADSNESLRAEVAELRKMVEALMVTKAAEPEPPPAPVEPPEIIPVAYVYDETWNTPTSPLPEPDDLYAKRLTILETKFAAAIDSLDGKLRRYNRELRRLVGK